MRIAEEIERSFGSGATILTANARAARWLQREYGLRQREAGRRTWATPPIEDWETWLRRQWEERALAEKNAPLLLTNLQERGVWTRVQRDDAERVVSPASMAALAESAYALLSAYEAHGERKHSWAKADAESFRQWAVEFDRECARRNWIPRAALEAKLAGAGLLKLPEEILLVGFDRITPAQGRLLRALEERGVSVRTAEIACAGQGREFIRAAGLREEITACAWGVREWMERNPEARIGILVPDLNAVRAEMERIFRRVLMPQADDIFSAQAMPFEFSLGQPLASASAVRASLLLLRWLTGPLREEEVSWLLLSGYLGSAEYLAAARQDAKLRESTPISGEITLAGFLGRAEGSRLEAFAKLDEARRAAAANRMDDLRLPGQWTELAQHLLAKAGWPGAAERGSIHFQTLRRWERALDEIALLDFDGERVGYSDFLRTLETHAAETIFSPESRGAPVQVMGALEASGQQFDAAWFLGVDDGSWPPLGRAHPLLPNELQRRFGMPYADAANDLELAKAVTARIGESAPQVVFSHAERNKDGELRASPLLPENAAWLRAQQMPLEDAPEPLEELEEPSASIPWLAEEPAGGVAVLKLQTACPFQAFATKRLRAEPLERREWGLSAAERGDLLHKVLHKVWSPDEGALHSLRELQEAISEGRLEAILDAAIAEVFARKFAQVGDPWLQEYLASEQRRLRRRLSEWMQVEASRVPFTVIECEKQLDDVQVGGLMLRLRADRIDELAGGERLLIDYKTGKVSPKDWEGPRPNEPQLPLYALFGGVENIHGALFARIRVGSEMGFAGAVEDLNRQLLPHAKTRGALGKVVYSEALRDEWEAALLVLAANFLRGEATVDPKDGKETCKYCPMPGLCRVAETRDALEEDLETEAYGDDDEPSR